MWRDDNLLACLLLEFWEGVFGVLDGARVLVKSVRLQGNARCCAIRVVAKCFLTTESLECVQLVHEVMGIPEFGTLPVSHLASRGKCRLGLFVS